MTENKLNKFFRAISDGYQNVVARLGLKADNLTSSGKYEWDGLVNNRQQLEYIYSYSWIARKIIEVPAADMTKRGVTLQGISPKDSSLIQKQVVDLGIWNSLKEAIMWARLYGGAICLIDIDGQDTSTPLDLDSIGPNQFRGLSVLSRWQLTPSTTQLIDEGTFKGEPEFYTSVFDNTIYSKPYTIHHSRVIKFVGITVPWFQKISLMFWGQSVIVNLHARIKAYDMCSAMLDQLSNKAHLRVFKIKGLRQLLATGGADAEADIQNYVALMRDTQSTEDINAIDSEDSLEMNSYAFTGIKELMEIQGEQLSGASGIPQSKLFGRPADGLGASQAGDIEIYHGSLESERESVLRKPLSIVLDIISRSTLSKPLPDDSSFTFDSLYSLDNIEQAQVADSTTNTITRAVDAKVITIGEARKEFKRTSLVTGVFSDLDDAIPSELLVNSNLSSDTNILGESFTDKMTDAIKTFNDKQDFNTILQQKQLKENIN